MFLFVSTTMFLFGSTKHAIKSTLFASRFLLLKKLEENEGFAAVCKYKLTLDGSGSVKSMP